MSLNRWKSLVAYPIGEFLKLSGFRKSGLKFSSSRPESTLVVDLQSSTGSTREVLKITCNLAISLQTPRGHGESSTWDEHWRQRIGHFLPERHDHWWICTSDDDAKAAGAEIATLLEMHALPEMERLASRAAMVALWKTGRSPGLTEGQRLRYLKKFA